MPRQNTRAQQLRFCCDKGVLPAGSQDRSPARMRPQSATEMPGANYPPPTGA
jgi:hypothetical protein